MASFLDYAPAPESVSILNLQKSYGLFIDGEFVKGRGKPFQTISPADEHVIAEIANANAKDVDVAVARRPPRLRPRVVEALRRRPRQVPLQDRPARAGAQPRARRRREPRQRQADQGEPGCRRAARRGVVLLLRRLGRQARLRRPRRQPARARRRCAGHPVELPAAHARVEDRAGARRGQHRRDQAGRDHAAQRADLRRDPAAGRPAQGRREHHHGRRRHGRGAREPPRRQQGRLHRLDRGRPRDREVGRGQRQEAHARARRQGREHRVRRRTDRPGGRGHRQRHLLQPGPRVLRRLAPARAGEHPRRGDRAAQAPPVDAAARRPARQEHRHRGDQLEGAARPHPRVERHRRAGGCRALECAVRHPRQGLLVRADDLHERVDQSPHRARGDLRPGALGAHVPHAGRGDHEGEQHARTVSRRASGATRARRSSRSPTSCARA